jgi:hypothetical protein
MLGDMSTVQVRDVRPETAAVLKRRAEQQGLSLSEYLRGELDRIAATPSRAEVLARIAERPAPALPDPVTELDRSRAERPGG